MATLAKNTVATCESLAAMGDLVSKLVAKNTAKNKHILDGDLAIRKRKKTEAVEKKKEVRGGGRLWVYSRVEGNAFTGFGAPAPVGLGFFLNFELHDFFYQSQTNNSLFIL